MKQNPKQLPRLSKNIRHKRRSNRFWSCPVWNTRLYCISDRRSTWIRY